MSDYSINDVTSIICLIFRQTFNYCSNLAVDLTFASNSRESELNLTGSAELLSFVFISSCALSLFDLMMVGQGETQKNRVYTLLVLDHIVFI